MSAINSSFLINEPHSEPYCIGRELGCDSGIIRKESDGRVREVGIQWLESIGSGFSQTLNPSEEEKRIETNLTPTSIAIGRGLDWEELEESGYWQQMQEIPTLSPTEFTSWETSNDEVGLFFYPFFFPEQAEKLPSKEELDPYTAFSPGCFQKTVATTNNEETSPTRESMSPQTLNQIDCSSSDQCCGATNQYCSILEEQKIETASAARLIQELSDLLPKKLTNWELSNNSVASPSSPNASLKEGNPLIFNEKLSCHDAFLPSFFQNPVATTNNRGEFQTASCCKHKLVVEKPEQNSCEIAKQKKAARDKAYREKNKERISERHRKNYLANKAKPTSEKQRYYLANKAKCCADAKKYYTQNKEALNEKHRQYYQQHKDVIRQRRKTRIENKKMQVAEPQKTY